MYSDNSMQNELIKMDRVRRQRMRVEEEIAKYEKLEAMKSIMRENLQFSQRDVKALSFKPQV